MAFLLAGQAYAQDDFEWRDLGEQTYTVTCASCHQSNGEGVPGTFPPLAGHVPDILAQGGGRDHLSHTVLYGLNGQIEVSGQSYDGNMPAWGYLGDEDLAAALNYVASAWGNEASLPEDFAWYGPDDVASAREADLTASDVYQERYRIGLAQPEPEGADARGADSGEAQDPDEIDPSEISYSDDTGYFTEQQAAQGAEAYAEHCAECHGQGLRGGFHAPALTSLGFFRDYGGQPMSSLHGYVSSRMPPASPGTLSDRTYVRIMAYWLSENEYPAGSTPLIPEDMNQITIENR